MANRISTEVAAICERVAAMPGPTEEEVAARIEAERKEQFNRLVGSCWDEWSRAVGERYHRCDTANFDPPNEAAKKAVASVADYCKAIRANVKSGAGLLLFGPKGTGKDHLLSAVSRHAIAHGIRVMWRNGADLFGDVRDAIGKEFGEKEFIRQFVQSPVLYLSDPLPPAGKLTEFQASTLFRILDGRYRSKRPTWVSVNATGRVDLEERLGAQNADRLRDGSLAIYCNWASHRKPAESVGAEKPKDGAK